MLKKKQKLQITYLPTEKVKENPNNPQTHPEKQIFKLAKSLNNFGMMKPILVDQNYQIIAGNAIYQAAKKVNLKSIPVIFIEHLTKEQIRAYIIADNKLTEGSEWNNDILKIEFENLIEFFPDFDITLTGFEIPEIDLIITDDNDNIQRDLPEKTDTIDLLPDLKTVTNIVKTGDLWQLGDHFLYCGDALNENSYKLLMNDKKATMVFADPPYNVPIKGNVSGRGKIKHNDFNMASGEMSSEEYTNFLNSAFKHLITYSIDGSIHYMFIDWRHSYEILVASKNIYKLMNVCIWDKQQAGMGSFYRSQHEFIYVFKNGTGPYINNIELGKHGRYRTNIWNYKGIHAMNRSTLKDLKLHPTVKPTAMIMDAILDASKPNDIILDCFAGSGSTLLAAEKTRRKAYVMEIDPKYCDVILHRFEHTFGKTPVLINRAEGDH